MRVDAKPEGLRQAMSWLHTWSALVLGWLLFAVFVTGSLSFFRTEIDEWMRPELHAAPAAAVPQAQLLDTALTYLQSQAPDAPNWTIALPTPRQSTLSVSWRKPAEPSAQAPGGPPVRPVTITRHLDPHSGQVITARETRGGGFLYRFHFELYGMPRIWARWIVIVATAAMLVAIVSGVITHKKIFSDFFTFRPKKGQRSWLDAHNASAVLSLPFHFVITLSGLLLLMNMVLPWTPQYVYEGDGSRFNAELRGQNNAAQQQPSPSQRSPRTERGGAAGARAEPVALSAATIAPLLEHARKTWGQEPVRISIDAPASTRTRIEVREGGGEHLSERGNARSLSWRSGADGQFIVQPAGDVAAPSAVRSTYNILTGTHLGRFAQPAVRWLLFVAGLTGALMVASGMVLWVVKRLPQRIKTGQTPRGHRLVEVLNAGTMAGLLLAVAGYWWLNRLLPVQWEGAALKAFAPTRVEGEIYGFFALWLVALVYAAWRTHRRAWLELMTTAAVLFALLPLLNAASGGAALPASIAQGQWAVAFVDVMACVFAAVCVAVVWWLRRTAPKTVQSKSQVAALKAQPSSEVPPIVQESAV